MKSSWSNFAGWIIIIVVVSLGTLLFRGLPNPFLWVFLNVARLLGLLQ